jgi:hypothetical protein
MDYLKAYTYFAKKHPKHGWNNLLFGVVCQLIPIVGPIVFYGYRMDCAQDLEDDPEQLHHRHFDFNNFGHYLMRGLPVFVMQLVAGMIAAIVGGGLGVLVWSIAPSNDPGFRLLFGAVAGYAFYFLSLFAVIAVVWTLECHVAISGRFRVGEAFAFAGKFLPLMWKRLILSVFIYFFAGVILGLLGTLMCFIGLYLVLPIMAMAEGHMIVQMYTRFLEKGGEPIPRIRAGEDED